MNKVFFNLTIFMLSIGIVLPLHAETSKAKTMSSTHAVSVVDANSSRQRIATDVNALLAFLAYEKLLAATLTKVDDDDFDYVIAGKEFQVRRDNFNRIFTNLHHINDTYWQELNAAMNTVVVGMEPKSDIIFYLVQPVIQRLTNVEVDLPKSP